MSQATFPLIAATPHERLRAAVENEEVRLKLFNHAFVRLRSRHDAEDAVQEARTRVWKKRDEYDPGRDPVAWIYRFLTRVIAEIQRGQSKHSPLPAEPAAPQAGFDIEGLHDLMAVLDESQRRLVTMHYIDELPHAEIARRLGISVGNARVKLSRALNFLRDHVVRKEGTR